MIFHVFPFHCRKSILPQADLCKRRNTPEQPRTGQNNPEQAAQKTKLTSGGCFHSQIFILKIAMLEDGHLMKNLSGEGQKWKKKKGYYISS